MCQLKLIGTFSMKTYLPILVIYYYILKFDVTYMDFKSAINKIYLSIASKVEVMNVQVMEHNLCESNLKRIEAFY